MEIFIERSFRTQNIFHAFSDKLFKINIEKCKNSFYNFPEFLLFVFSFLLIFFHEFFMNMKIKFPCNAESFSCPCCFIDGERFDGGFLLFLRNIVQFSPRESLLKKIMENFVEILKTIQRAHHL
jgi:hypothetical protein